MCRRQVMLGELERVHNQCTGENLLRHIMDENDTSMIGYVHLEFPRLRFMSEDLVAEVFADLWSIVREGIKAPEAPVKRWLFKRLRQKCLNEVRKIERIPIKDPTGTDSEWLELIVSKDAVEVILRSCKEHLSKREQEVIELMYREGKSQIEVAKLLELSKGRISQLHKTATLKLKARLQESGILEELRYDM